MDDAGNEYLKTFWGRNLFCNWYILILYMKLGLPLDFDNLETISIWKHHETLWIKIRPTIWISYSFVMFFASSGSFRLIAIAPGSFVSDMFCLPAMRTKTGHTSAPAWASREIHRTIEASTLPTESSYEVAVWETTTTSLLSTLWHKTHEDPHNKPGPCSDTSEVGALDKHQGGTCWASQIPGM